MPKRTFTIKVMIDTTETARKTRASNMRTTGRNSYEVFVCRSRNKRDGSTLASMLLHEIGHVMAEEMVLPGATNDPRGHSGRLQAAKLIEVAEKEAWDIAEKLRKSIKKDRKLSVNSYKKNVKEWEKSHIERIKLI